MPAGNETRRQICLQAMDIQCWYPRRVLPHAAVSRAYVADDAAPVPADAAVRADTDPAQPAPKIPPVLQALSIPEPPQPAPGPQPPSSEAPVSEVPVAEAPIAEAPAAVEGEVAAERPVPHFAFAYLSFGETLAVIAEIPYASRGRLQAAVRGLLSRILEAVNVTVRSGSTPVIHFHWPLHEGDHLEQGMDSARQTVEGFLSRQLRERPVPFLLVFSEQWPGYLFPAQFQQVPEGLFAHPQFPVQVLLTRGLHAMLADESVKRPAWKQLQALKAQIEMHATGGQ